MLESVAAWQAEVQEHLDQDDMEGAGYASIRLSHLVQERLGIDEEGDYVFNLTQAHLEPGERRMVLDEIRRQGFGTEYNNEAYPMSVCLTIAKKTRDVDYEAAKRALMLLEAVEPLGDLQYVCFPYPYENGVFREIYRGPLRDFVQGVAS